MKHHLVHHSNHHNLREKLQAGEYCRNTPEHLIQMDQLDNFFSSAVYWFSSRVQTFSSWNQQQADSSEEEEGQAYYAGGSEERLCHHIYLLPLAAVAIVCMHASIGF